MKYEWLESWCLSKKGAEREYKPEWEAVRFLVGGKQFAMLGGDRDKKPILSLKCDPAVSDGLRREYRDIVPGYYLNKQHWNSVYLEGEVPDELIKSMIDMSYDLVFLSLTGKKREEII